MNQKEKGLGAGVAERWSAELRKEMSGNWSHNSWSTYKSVMRERGNILEDLFRQSGAVDSSYLHPYPGPETSVNRD